MLQEYLHILSKDSSDNKCCGPPKYYHCRIMKSAPEAIDCD